MKKSALVALCLMTMFLANRSHAQARFSSANYVLSINPLDLLLNGPLDIQLEVKSSPTNSWAFRGYFQTQYLGYGGFGLGAAYRFYIADSRALTGLNVAPAVDVIFYQSSTAGIAGGTTFFLGGDIGYKWIFSQFAVEPLVGVRIGIGGVQGVGYTTGARASIGLYLGYAW